MDASTPPGGSRIGIASDGVATSQGGRPSHLVKWPDPLQPRLTARCQPDASSSAPVAAGVALHQMAVEGGMMKMRAVPSLELRPGARIELQPGGYHLMLLDLKHPLKAGDKFPMMLTFERGGPVTVPVQVEPMGA